MIRRRVDDAGIYRRASQSDQNQPCKGYDVRTGQEHDNDAGCNNSLPQTDHLYIIQFHCNKTADRTSYSDADEEHSGKTCGSFRRNSFKQVEITAGPQAGSLFDRTVAEEAEHDLLCAGNPYDFCK